MAQKQKRGGEKGSILSVRVSPKIRWQLERAARKNQRKLSREIEGRLNFTFGRYGTGRPTHIADLAELVALLAQSVERRTRREWDRHPATREYLIRAFTNLVDVYSKAIVGDVTPSSISLPPKLALDGDDPASMAVKDMILFLLPSPLPLGWEDLPEIYGPGGDVLWRIQRNFAKRRRKK